jgi:hypothetical protein
MEEAIFKDASFPAKFAKKMIPNVLYKFYLGIPNYKDLTIYKS